MESASTGSRPKSTKISSKDHHHHSSSLASPGMKERSKHSHHKKKKLRKRNVSSSEVKVHENNPSEKAFVPSTVFQTSNRSPESSVPIKDCSSSSSAPIPADFAFDDSISTRSSMKAQKILDESGPVALDVSESPLPPSTYDESFSKAYHLKKTIRRDDIDCPVHENAPMPVGFVFDDSTKSSIKFKMHSKASYGENINTCNSILPPDETEQNSKPFSYEGVGSAQQDTSKFPNEGACCSERRSTVPLPENPNGSFHSNINHHTELSTETQATSRNTTNTCFQHSGSSSTNSSTDIERGLANEFEIVADAVAVEEPDIYDAQVVSNDEATAPNIVINQTYSYPDEQARHKGKGMWDSKFCYPVMILIALILGCGFIILGITLGIKKKNNPNNYTNSTTNNVDSTSVDVSSFTIDDHSQVSNVAYNKTTNHYTIQYNNGTSTEVAYVLINDNDSLISSLHFNDTLNHYIVTYKNSTTEDIVSVC